MKVVFILGLCMLLPNLVGAQVVINEIAWMGSEVEGVNAKQWWRYEWIELFNTGSVDVVLNGWTIELHREQVDYVIPLQGVIKQREYFVAGASGKIKNIHVNYGSLMGKFANDGQLVLLKDNKGKIVDTVNAKTGWFAGENTAKLTMERRFSEKDSTDTENWGSSLMANGSLGAENTIFGKEAVIQLDSKTKEIFKEKKSPIWASFFAVAGNKVFILAVLLSLGSAFSLVFLRRYLVQAPQKE